MIIDIGENLIGYQYLHGINSRVGGFQMYGKISKLLNGTVICDMTYVCNGISVIYPNTGKGTGWLGKR